MHINVNAPLKDLPTCHIVVIPILIKLLFEYLTIKYIIIIIAHLKNVMELADGSKSVRETLAGQVKESLDKDFNLEWVKPGV